MTQIKDRIETFIEPMGEDFILWRCLHSGPLSQKSIDELSSDSQINWIRYRDRNVPLLKKLTQTYEVCAFLARAGDQIVGQLRFYPKVVWRMKSAGELCLQQDFPNGPAENFTATEFSALSQLEDKTLIIHCLMMGSSQQSSNPFQRKGIGSRLVKTLIDWAKLKGWERIAVSLGISVAKAKDRIVMRYDLT